VQPLPVEPSPKFQAQVSVPVPPDGVVLKVTVCPGAAGFGLAVVMTADGVGFTITVTLLEAFPPTASVAVTVAVNEPLAL